MRLVFLSFSLAAVCLAQYEPVSAARIRAHTKFLSSDLMEGRGVGTRGDLLATEYLAAQFALAGARPAGDGGTYFQRVPLVGVESEAGSQLSAAAGGRTVALRWLEEAVGASGRQTSLTEFEGDAVYVGHGIVAPEYGWDDFKGADVRGKVLVFFTNEPASNDPKFFGGRALTYYGRWTYKFEQALRQGALGAIIVHTTPTAGYGWQVVRTSWGRENPQVKRKEGDPALSFAGWVSSEAGRKLFDLAGRKLEEMLRLSEERDFRPIPLGVRIKGRLPTKVRPIETRNVAAVVEGSDPKLKQEAVILSAHWDHLGVGEAVDGDAIYNGAVDNATGCAMLIEMARAWASLDRKPRRSALFLALTAEEGGLLGSEYYAAHPIFPPGKTAAGLNFDAFYPFGRTRDVTMGGAERTTLWPILQDLARRAGYEVKPDPRPEQGSFYRSDHFPLAKAGIPAFSIHGGTDFAGKPADYGKTVFQEFNARNYHQPSDEYREDWDFSGMEAIARFGFLIGQTVANLESLPSWQAGDEFLPARQASGVK